MSTRKVSIPPFGKGRGTVTPETFVEIRSLQERVIEVIRGQVTAGTNYIEKRAVVPWFNYADEDIRATRRPKKKHRENIRCELRVGELRLCLLLGVPGELRRKESQAGYRASKQANKLAGRQTGFM